MCLCPSPMPRNSANKPIELHTGYTQTGSLHDRSEQSAWREVLVTVSVCRWRSRCKLKPLAIVAASVQWNGSPAGLARSVTPGNSQARALGDWTLSCCSPPGLEVQLISRWSPYPSVQTYGFRCSGPLLRMFPLHTLPQS